MSDDGRKGSIGPLIGLKVICCGALVLVATGALSGAGTWLLDGGLMWLVLALAVLAAGALLWWRPRIGADRAARGEQKRLRRSP